MFLIGEIQAQVREWPREAQFSPGCLDLRLQGAVGQPQAATPLCGSVCLACVDTWPLGHVSLSWSQGTKGTVSAQSRQLTAGL